MKSFYRCHFGYFYWMCVWLCFALTVQVQASSDFLEALSSSSSSSFKVLNQKKEGIGVTIQSEFEDYPNLNVDLPSEGEGSSIQHSFIINKVGVRYSKDIRKYHYFMDLSALYITSDSGLSLDVTEAYSLQEFSNNWSTSLGRKKYDWSWADKFFERGVWEPQWGWNKMRKKSQGLTGIFLQSPEMGGFNWILFASTGFIPDTGTKLKVSEGELSYNSPWSPSPAQTFELFDEDVPIHYKVTQPSLGRVLLQSPGFATKVSWQSEEIQWGASLAYKPMNKIYIYAPIGLEYDEEKDLHWVEANLHGVPHYHQVLGSELQWGMGRLWDFKLDWIYERPDSLSMATANIGQNVSSTNIYTFFVSRKLNEQLGVGSEFFVSHSFLDGEVMNIINDGEDDGINISRTILPSRYDLTNTTMVGLSEFLSPLFGSRFKSNLALAYDWDQEGFFIKSSLGMQWSSSFFTYLQADVLGLLGRSEAPEEKRGMIEKFSSLDTMRFGVRYDF